ncbi:MAG: methylated-DNA--[protein]-cysteine S-methyltransferase [Saprospiraceae bacterium]|nr:methylated-DNA--[protein]-cysteine S-methyltransferase [Saprospiraceae bacterium]MCB9326160.1 methylated-DNA--[protein]-cysteine S-methyltransferase [Lewinellaceae bacterium]
MKKQLTFQEKYQAILDKDATYEGVFITAVKTTGIFCRPACTARKPKKENVVFYDSINEAILNGYRPCKICRPMEPAEAMPDYIRDILEELNEHPYKKIKDYDLVLRGIEPNTIRRWFRKHYDMTFHGYQRMLRINLAYKEISGGKSVTQAAYDAGFESLSGFNSSYQNIFGASATQSGEKNMINIIRFTTPLGPMFACATEKGLCLLEFTNRKMLETEFKDLSKRLNAVILPGKNTHLDQTEVQLKEYFEGNRKNFSIPLHTPGTAFQNKVWETLQTIPYGETLSYEQMAIKTGNPKAVRAVGTANGFNRISVIIPCHRVIGKNGHLTGYGGGLERKKWLLDFEKENHPETSDK